MGKRTIKKILKTEIQNTRENNESSKKRKFNINWIENLPRTNLNYQIKENQILITDTKTEEVSIQYPGKESALTREKPKPWDFRPVILEKATNNYINNINSFVQIWGELFEILESTKNKESYNIRVLATLFYRMAFMLDHKLCTLKQKTRIRCITPLDNIVKNEIFVELNPWYRYEPSEIILKQLSKTMPFIGGISLKAFLYYNDLLAWNEDCKYYYRNRTEKQGKWIGPTGRINNLLTHVAIIGLVLGDIKLQNILGRFTRTRGVSPPINEEIITLCNNFIHKKIEE